MYYENYVAIENNPIPEIKSSHENIFMTALYFYYIRCLNISKPPTKLPIIPPKLANTNTKNTLKTRFYISFSKILYLHPSF